LSSKERFDLVKLDPNLDTCEPYLKLVDDFVSTSTTLHETHKSYLRSLFVSKSNQEKNQPIFKNLNTMHFFGLQGQKITQAQADMVLNDEVYSKSLVYLTKDIRR